MNPLKLGAIILILTAGLAGGYLIIKDSKMTGSGSYITLESSGKAAEKSQKFPIQWMEKAKDFLSDPIESLGLNDKADENNLDNVASFNLTEFVAKSVFNQMQTLDQKGVENIDPNDPKNQEIIEKAIASLQDPALFFEQTIDDKSLKISQDNSKEVKIQYLRGLEQISNNRLLNNPKYLRDLEQVMKDIQIDCMTGGLSIHKELAQLQLDLLKDTLNLTVPQDWLSLHREAINYYQKANLIYSALANCLQDPIKGSLAAQAWPQFIEENQRIQSAFYAKWLEMGL